MNTYTALWQSAGKKVQCVIKPLSTAIGTCALVLGLATAAQAAPITGDPQTNAFGWIPNSTNALNYVQQAPGRVGQSAPYVIFSSNSFGAVVLDFYNIASGVTFFETRIDGVQTGGSPHSVVIGDTQHTGGTFVAANDSVLGKTFNANSYVDIRLALGAEADWRFDWVRFEVPVPGTLVLFGLGLAGLAASRRRS